MTLRWGSPSERTSGSHSPFRTTSWQERHRHPFGSWARIFVSWRAPDGRVGFLAEACPHRQASLLLARVEGDGLRCIYHGWKTDISGAVVDAPTQVSRHDRFCASIKVTHFPVHEAGNIAWVWLGSPEPAPFPDLPFTADHGNKTAVTFSTLPVNWLQALEGGLDSVHAGILHQSWTRNVISEKSDSMDEGKATVAFTKIPTYEVGEATFGMRAASLRKQDDGNTYARVTNFFFPLVIVAATGFVDRYHVFAFAPVDDTNHLLFFGSYGTSPVSQKDFGAVREDFESRPAQLFDRQWRSFESLGSRSCVDGRRPPLGFQSERG